MDTASQNQTLPEPHQFALRLPRLLSWSILILLVVGSMADGAELPTSREIVAEAGKACESLTAPADSGPKPGIQERFERDMRQRALVRLASARVHVGDFDGAIEALNRVNSDAGFSQISVQAMRTELTGMVPPWPAELPPQLKETQKSVLADILRKHGRFEAALEMAQDIGDEQVRAQSTAQTLLDIGMRGMVVQQAADDIQKSASSAQKKTFANFVKTLLRERDELHLSMLVVAAELFNSAADKDSADASIEEAMSISAERKKDYRPFIAGWLAENGRFGKAYDLINALDDPKQKAQALSELAFQMTKPAKP